MPELEKAEAAGEDILKLCVEVGGCLTGEHGVGQGKMKYLKAEHGEALAVMRAIKHALDPLGIMNPGKLVP